MRPKVFLTLMFRELCDRVEGTRGLRALCLIQEWVRIHERQWKPTWRASWSLEYFVRVELATFPVEQSSLDIEGEFRRRKTAPPDSFERLAEFVSELLWR